ncbi:MAG: MAPEG family protein [Roseomonas sp.]|nr:MAPEG family protein [Roseomonas sp.]MCA3327309.1 MAPEG family protein [Roseomonas sp.]MCA3331831.1 MAPEG family protein [Roseomonas sp.]MCA3336699.1 MAPEG family protein [Roseomonas sp.]MCA3346462.1 MAPEG family protein [Roseomonas sp.]
MIIAFWTLPLTLIFLWLSFRVIRHRRSALIPLGAGGDARLERAIRAHANFAEYVPFAVLLLVLAEWGGAWPWLLHALGALLVAARLSHGMGIAQEPEDYRFRVFGMTGTFSVLGIAALAAFWGALMRG